MAAPKASPALQARFQRLVGPHLDRLASFASRRLSGNTADAEDVLQDACARAWLGFASLRDDSQVLAWLYRIVRSALSDFLDKRGRRERLAPTLTLESFDDMVTTDPGPLERLLDSLSSSAVYDALHSIPEEFALAVELHDIEGLRYGEIAELTAVPIGTVMSRIYRGRKQLAAVVLAETSRWDLAGRERDAAEDRLHQRRI